MKPRRWLLFAAAFLLAIATCINLVRWASSWGASRPYAGAVVVPPQPLPTFVEIAASKVLPADLSDQIMMLEASASSSAASASVLTEDVSGLENGVILFLYGGRWHDYFVAECLPRLNTYFLACFPYPIHIFNEEISAKEMTQIRSKVNPASRVDFEDVSRHWKTLPHGISEKTLENWRSGGLQRKFQGRGYRLMCRFWAGLAWSLPSMDKYKYYWRLDTDSIITKPLRIDPFAHFAKHSCRYGYNRLKGESPAVAVELWATYNKWADQQVALGTLQPDVLTYIKRFATQREPTGDVPVVDRDLPHPAFWAPMFYNNFELGTFELKRHPLYTSFFRFVDEQEPFGILRYRWGDAPLHTLGVLSVLGRDTLRCNYSQEVVPYKHASTRPPPMVPGEGCVKDKNAG
jgi:hypothetical protein